MSVEVRLARPSDLEALVAIETTAFHSDRISRRSFRRLLASGSARVLAAAADGELVGYAIVLYRSKSRVARLYSIAVASESAGSGVGRRLLEAAEEAAGVDGRLVLRLEVREDNARAISLYERSGYRRTGRSAAYYADGAAALRLERILPRDGPPVHLPASGCAAS